VIPEPVARRLFAGTHGDVSTQLELDQKVGLIDSGNLWPGGTNPAIVLFYASKASCLGGDRYHRWENGSKIVIQLELGFQHTAQGTPGLLQGSSSWAGTRLHCDSTTTVGARNGKSSDLVTEKQKTIAIEQKWVWKLRHLT